MQADITDKLVLLVQIDRRLEMLARLRAGAMYGVVLGLLLLSFTVGARPAQPLLPWIAGGLLCSLALPLLLVAHFSLRLEQDAHRGLVRYLFRRGHRVEYSEVSRADEVWTPSDLDFDVRSKH